MSVCQHFLKTAISVTQFQKNLEKWKNVIIFCHKRCLCKVCIEMQFPVAGAPMVQMYSVLVFLILDQLLRNCRGGPQKSDKPHTENSVFWHLEESFLCFLVFLVLYLFPLQFLGLAHTVGAMLCVLTQKPAEKSYLNIVLRTWRLWIIQGLFTWSLTGFGPK